jgi:hypothetical protein
VNTTSRPFASRYFVEIFYLVALGACFFVYHQIGDNYLYNDDFRWMRQARNDMRPGNILTFQVTGFFRPLMNVVFYTTERLMPGNIAAYYATNLVLHFFTGVLVFHLLWRIAGSRGLAAASALFFLITCTHSAAVEWISARTSLISTALLLSSLLLVAGRPRVRWRRWCAVALYVLALAAKEEAVVGVLLLALVQAFRDRTQDALPDRRTLVYFGVATAVYIGVRTVVIGHVEQSNWGPGLHALRNLAGGFLYQVYPWSLASLLRYRDPIEVPTNPVWPEILAVVVIVLLLAAGRLLGKSREVRFGLAWLSIALLPVSLFRFRFLTSDWLTHDRYYYLSSVGASLCIVALLAGLWNLPRRRTVARAVVIVCAVVILLGERQAVENRAGRFRRMTGAYRALVELVSRRMAQHAGFDTCAIDGWPLQRPFMQDVFALEQPGWKVVSVESKDAARAYRPCLYVRIHVEQTRVGSEADAIR